MPKTPAQIAYEGWISNPKMDTATLAELVAIADHPEEIEDRFYQDLQFGTAGLRGIMGAGTNRMNPYTVARAAEGFALYIESLGEEACRRGIAISYDSRNRSREFAELAASIFIGRKIAVRFSDELRPVPMLSFAIRHFGCSGGIMLTASHNPKQYNGFKAYSSDGAQLGPDEAGRVAAMMETVTDLPGLLEKTLSFDEAGRSPLFHLMGGDLDDLYDASLLALTLNGEAVRQNHDIPIVYSPFNGTGNKPVRRILKKHGFTKVSVVPEQELPDGNFPSTPTPNPELPETLELAIALARETGAGLVLATDPDADRTGVAVRASDGSFVLLSGNEIGLLLMDYILGTKSVRGELEADSFCVSTVVSSRLTRAISDHYGTGLYLSLTGFKHIAAEIHKYGDLAGGVFQFGYEESFGYLLGTKVRDKDAVVTCLMIAEMAAVSAASGQTLIDRLAALYEKYGQAAENTISIIREGKVGLEKIAGVMQALREKPFEEFEPLGIVSLSDFQQSLITHVETGRKEALDYPESNVLLYQLQGLDFMCVRPSGTEPKIKIYFGCYGKDLKECRERQQKFESIVLARVNRLLGA
ncbi:MAG TPA: phospho-sugar mutase [Bacillota bacterium]|nr:phospho-sugar mutase [Fastidiosipila sp.]HPX92876.1 phospho-sugar mutase [Bacillota bacterium]HQB80734.1 phospho-sugar mutase [Bacillota bacterium]